MAIALLYFLLFLSGAAALIYQVVWVRSLTLVFGGSSLAVTAVLAIFMAGLAVGSYVFGRRADQTERPLRLYGLLELGIAASALLCSVLLRLYPSIYPTLTRGHDDGAAYLTAVRLLFSVVALAIPTVLIGGTLPLVARVLSRQAGQLRRHLSFLYGINTLGAVLGTLVAGFVLLRVYAVSTTLYLAVAINVLIGIAVLALQSQLDATAPPVDARPEPPESTDAPSDVPDPRILRMALWGIGVSGFCALGYEVLWTRVLAAALGASVYSFTIILAAFLAGIALGSHIYGLVARVWKGSSPSATRHAIRFGLIQILIGVTAILVTVYLRDIPVNVVRLQHYFAGDQLVSFGARTWAGFSLAFLYIVVPALFMGAAFPVAGEMLALRRGRSGRAVGDALAFNTVGAIVGAVASGLVLIRFFGIERSLEFLAVLNVGLGMFVLAAVRKRTWLTASVTVAVVAVLAALALNPTAARVWDRKYLAIFRNNQPDAFSTPDMVREAVENTDVLYYGEGTEAIVSVIRVKGGEQAFLTNGRVEASSHTREQQLQFALGHLPTLLARDPKNVLVIGLGSGMTAGATSVHSSVDGVSLVEIEPQVLGVARAFSTYNHQVLDNPKVKLRLDDGRNFLATTEQSFDVITADPIHPWCKGAGSLYSSEYFALAAKHLRPGGVIAQWLPIYELTAADLASVVKTVQLHFPHTMLWLTHYDAVIVGSTEPFTIDESELERRIAEPAIAGDLKKVTMGSAEDLLSYFVMGTEGMKVFAKNGILNTDDRPYLEYSAPFSIANSAVMAANVEALAAHRESILPYLKPASDPAGVQAQEERWGNQEVAGKRGDQALALFLGQGPTEPGFTMALRQLNLEYPTYAPGRALWAEYQNAAALEPRLLARETFHLLGDKGAIFAEVAAVLVPVSKTRASVMFVDNRTRTIYGQVYLDDYDREERASKFATDVIATIRATYDKLAAAAKEQNGSLPAAPATLQTITTIIASKVQGIQSGS